MISDELTTIKNIDKFLNIRCNTRSYQKLLYQTSLTQAKGSAQLKTRISCQNQKGSGPSNKFRGELEDWGITTGNIEDGGSGKQVVVSDEAFVALGSGTSLQEIVHLLL
jgi:hypothetical protein